MDKKLKIRIVICSVALVSALVILGLSTGFINYAFKGYNYFFDSNKYIQRQVFVKEQYTALKDEKYIKVSAPDTFSGDKTLSYKIFIKTESKNGKNYITLTFKNKYNFNGGAIFSAILLEQTGSLTNVGANDNQSQYLQLSQISTSTGVSTTVSVTNGSDSFTANLISYKFNRAKSTFTYEVEADFEKIIVKGFWVNQFGLR